MITKLDSTPVMVYLQIIVYTLFTASIIELILITVIKIQHLYITYINKFKCCLKLRIQYQREEEFVYDDKRSGNCESWKLRKFSKMWLSEETAG